MSRTSDADSRSAKLKSSFNSLSVAAHNVNAASSALGNAITALNDALVRLNPGVEAWVTFCRWTEEDSQWTTEEERLGYAKTNNRWGISLARVTVDNSDSTETTQESWLFNDAPRSMRLRAIDDIPQLIEALSKEAERTAKRLAEGAEVALELAKSIGAISEDKGSRQ
jgi:hypothetical protein